MDGQWPAYTTLKRSETGHVNICDQAPRIQPILEKAVTLADKIFFFQNPYLEYPNKLNAFRRLLLDAAADKVVGDEAVLSRWKVDRKQMMIARGVVRFFTLSPCVITDPSEA